MTNHYSGKQLPWAPELTANAGVSYTWQSGLYALADLSWTGETFFDAANTLKEDGYALVNMAAGYRIDNWDISLWCRNLFDEEYITKKVNNSSNQALVEDGEPLTVGITLTWRI